MADVIAAGAVRIDGDASGLDSAVANAGRSLDTLAQKGAQAGKATSAGMKEAAAGATGAEQATERLTSKQAQFISSLERLSVRTASTTSEYQAWRAAQLGLTTQAEPLIAKIRETEQALSGQSAAMKELAAQAAFDKQNQEAARLVKSAEYVRWWTDSLQAADVQEKAMHDTQVFNARLEQAAKLNQASSYVGFWNAALSELDAKEAAARDTQVFDERIRDAERLNKASDYVRFWNAEIDKMEANERHLAGQTSFLNSLQQQSAAIGKTRSELLELRAAEMGVSTQAAPFIAKLKEQEVAFNKAGISAAQYQAALRGTPAQITDIFVSLQGGQAPLTVALQQGGQLKDMFGGIVPAAKALGSTALGMVSPLTAVAGALAVLAAAYNSGSDEGQRFENSLTSTGSRAGVTADQLEAMAKRVSASFGTQGAAADALAQLVETGRLGSEGLESMARAAVASQSATGKAVADTVAEFVGLADSPVQAVETLNKKYNFLTAAVYEQIKALSDQGDVDAAAALAQATYAQAVEDRATKIKANLGTLERAWDAIKGAAKGAWDAMLNVGREDSLATRIAEQEAIVRQAQSALSGNGFSDTGGGAATGRGGAASARARTALAEAETLLATLRSQRDAEEQAAAAAGKKADQERAAIEWLKEGDKYLSGRAKLDKEHADNVARITAQAKAAGIADSERTARLAEETKRYNRALESENKRGAGGANRINKADLSSDIADIQARYQALLSTSANAERVLEAQRAAGLVMEGDYYAKKREFIRSDADLQVQALQEENTRIQAQKATGADQINNDKKVAQNKAQMASIQAKATTDIVISNVQEQASLKKLQNAYQDARDAAQQYLATTSDRYMRELRGMGMGGQWRDQNAARDQINDRYQLQREQLQGDVRRNQITREQYDVYLGIVNDANQQALDLDRGYWQDKLALQGDWTVGAREAFANYADSAANVARMTEDLFGNAFQGMEDALVDFATTGKLSFSDMANSIIADLIRIQVRQALMNSIGGASGWLSGMLGGSSGAYGSASTSAGSGAFESLIQSYAVQSAKGNVFQSAGLHQHANTIVSQPTLFAFAKGAGLMGEAGPEAIMPLTRGPNGRLGVAAHGNGAGGGGGGLIVNIHKGADEDGVQESTSSDGKRQLDIYIRRAVRSTVDMEMAKPSGGVFGRFNENRYGMKKVV